MPCGSQVRPLCRHNLIGSLTFLIATPKPPLEKHSALAQTVVNKHRHQSVSSLNFQSIFLRLTIAPLVPKFHHQTMISALRFARQSQTTMMVARRSFSSECAPAQKLKEVFEDYRKTQ